MSVAEVVVVVLVLGILGLLILTDLPRRREVARSVGCEANLMQIGAAMNQYMAATGALPTTPEFGPGPFAPDSSPLGSMLTLLGVDDFSEVDPKGKPKPGASRHREAKFIAGFICPSDTVALMGAAGSPRIAPSSYRAVAGSRVDGGDGLFAPGRVLTPAKVEAGDGLSYTAAFGERVLGSGQDTAVPSNYAIVGGEIPPEGLEAAPAGATWKGDAGSNWSLPGWPSTHLNHAIQPGAPLSLVSASGRTAQMGASSGHVRGVHVLLLDGGVRSYSQGVSPKIWRGLAKIDDLPAATATPVTP
ncbi:DUF1559 domain-containing protein [Isosphaeraceae bacterium EP7]